MNLEVVWSVKLQGRRPCCRFSWLPKRCDDDVSGCLFLLDGTRIRQLSLDTGKTRHTLPSLSGVQLVLSQASRSGTVVAGLTEHGHMVTWLQPSLQLATFTTPLSAPTPHPQDLQGCHLFVSDSGEQGLLVTRDLDLHLWELRDGLHSEWWKLPAPEDISLPRTASRHTAVDATFYVHQALGECCECDIIFTNQETDETTIANLLLTWDESDFARTALSPTAKEEFSSNHYINVERQCQKKRVPAEDTTATRSVSSGTQPAPVIFPVTVDWKTCAISGPGPTIHHSPCGGGCYVVKLSPTARVAAVAVNHNTAADTRILFMDLWNEVCVSSPVYVDSSRDIIGRTFSVSSLAWSGDGLLLAAMTLGGSLLLLSRFGPPLRLITSGCGLDMGPAHHLPLHPLITLQKKSLMNVTDRERDSLRQRFSVATHPYLPVVLCSDGYCLTILRLPSVSCSLPQLVSRLINTGRSLLGLPQVEALTEKLAYGEVEGISQVHHGSVESMFGSSGHCHGTSVTGSGFYAIRVEGSPTACHGEDELKNLHDVGQIGREKLAQSHMLGAWGLLLSAGYRQPGNGVYSCYLSSHIAYQLFSDMDNVKNLVIKTLSQSSLEGSFSQELFSSALSMSFLDQLDQNSNKLVYTLANSYLLHFLSDLLQQHTDFTSKSTHTNLSVEAYAKHVVFGLQQFWMTFQKIAVLVVEIYGLSSRDPQNALCLPLLVLRRICTILSKDLLACNRMLQIMLPSGPDSLGLQGREAGVVQGGVAKHISEASAVLASISDILASYFNKDAKTNLLLTGLSTQKHFPSSNTEGGVGLERVPCLLQKCQLKLALECVYGVIAGNLQSAVRVPACDLSVPGLSVIPSSVLASHLVSLPLLSTTLHLVARFMAALLCNKTAKTVRCPIPAAEYRLPLTRKSIEVACKTVTDALSKQNLTSNWTPTHAVELLLLGSLWYKAARLATKMGDWRKGLILCVLHITLIRRLADYHDHAKTSNAFTTVEDFAHRLAVGKILRKLGLSRDGTVAGDVEEPQHDLPFHSGILPVCDSGGLGGVCPQVCFHIHQRLWTTVARLPVRVPEDFSLPLAPLSITSPSTDTKDTEEEFQRRQTLAYLMKCSMRMLWGANSLDLCRGWYSRSLVQLHCNSGACPSIRHMPCVDGTITQLQMPPSLLQLSANCPSPDSDMTHNIQCQMVLFRELCGLLWLLHVRDNASYHLRQILKENGSESEQTVSECAVWCARLEPLSHCHKNPSHVEEIFLSVLSVLPCNHLLVTLMAQNFPGSTQPGLRRLKVEQLLAGMRTAVSERGNTDVPLSVDYQVMSQAVLEDRASGSLQAFGPLCLKSGHGPQALSLKERALHVGTFVFEYDQGYLDFLDTLFSTKPSMDSLVTGNYLELFTQNSTSNTLRNTSSSFHRLSVASLPPESGPLLVDMQALVTYLYEWSQRTDSRTPVTSSSRGQQNKTKPPAMIIELSLSFLTYCLKLEEEKHQLIVGGYPSSSSPQATVTACTDSEGSEENIVTLSAGGCTSTLSTITPLPDDTSSLTTVTSTQGGITSAMSGGLNLCSMTTITPLPDDTSSLTTTTADDSTLHAEDLDTTDTSRLLQPCPFPLLHVPKDATPIPKREDEHPNIAISVHSLSPNSTLTGDGLTEAASAASSGQLLSNVDLTDSQSTGEVPSLPTFSVGEFGSEVPPLCTPEVLGQSPPLAPPANGDCGWSNRTHQLIQVPQLLHYQLPGTEEIESIADTFNSKSLLIEDKSYRPNAYYSPADTELLAQVFLHSEANATSPDTSAASAESPTGGNCEVDGSGVEGGISKRNVVTERERRDEAQDTQADHRTFGGSGVELSGITSGEGKLCIGQNGDRERKTDVETMGGEGERGRGGGGEERGRSYDRDSEGSKRVDDATEQGSKVETRNTGGGKTEQHNKPDQDMSAEILPGDQDLSRATEPPLLAKEDSGTRFSRELGMIVQSELQKFFEGQHQQLMGMFDDKTPDRARSSTTVSSHSEQLTTETSPNSKHKRQSWTSMSHVPTGYFQGTVLLPEPPRPLHTTASSRSLNLHSLVTGEKGIHNILPELPLLQLDQHTGRASPSVQGPQLRPPSVSRRPGSFSDLPLLSLDRAGREEPLLATLQHIPVSPHVPRPPLPLTAKEETLILPLLQYPHPNLTLVNQDTHSMCVPFQTSTIHRLSSPPPTPGRPPARGPLPLLLPTHQATPSLPSLVTAPPSSPLELLLPADIVLKNQSPGSQEAEPSTENPQKESSDHSVPPASTHSQGNKGRNAQEEGVRPSCKRNRQSQGTAEEQQPTIFTTASVHPHMDSIHLPQQSTLLPKPSLHLSPLSLSTQYTTTPGSTCSPSTGNHLETTQLHVYAHGEGVPQSKQQFTARTMNARTMNASTESGCGPMDLPSRQTAGNSPQTLSSLPILTSVEKKVRCSNDTDYYDRGSPFSSTADCILEMGKREDEGERGLLYVGEVWRLMEGGCGNVLEQGEGRREGGDLEQYISQEAQDERSKGISEPRNLQTLSPESKECLLSCQRDLEEEGGEGETERGSRQMARREVLSQLRRLETQLTAIETTARTVEGELLVSNQLLGTIEELQAVNREDTLTATSHTTHEIRANQLHTVMDISSDCMGKDALSSTCPASSTTTTTTTTTTATLTSLTSRGAHKDSLTTYGIVPVGTTVGSLSPAPLPSTSSPPTPSSTTITTTTSAAAAVRHVPPISQPLSGRCSRQTLRKWVTAKKREKSSSSPETWSPCLMVSQSTGKGHLRRTQSQEHMGRRMEDALTLMEDLLSAERPSPSLHPTTHHQSVPSRPSSSERGYHSSSDAGSAGTTTVMNILPTRGGSSVWQSGRRCCSSVEGLSQQEQLKMADIMTSTELSSVSSGSVASRIDWELVDHLIDN